MNKHNPPPASGILYVVATPIGNLGDISERAISVLKEVELILAEDTRTFKKLSTRFSINTRVQSYHDHNEQLRVPDLLDKLKNGTNIAIVSEAGTPTISDPGFRIVQACKNESLPVSPIPGACAAIAALSVSGFETDRFAFHGFVPQKQGKRSSALQNAVESEITTIFYESPHRIVKTLEALKNLAPEHEICLARELTKLHEEILRGSVTEVTEDLKARASIKGEIVLILRRHEKQRKRSFDSPA